MYRYLSSPRLIRKWILIFFLESLSGVKCLSNINHQEFYFNLFKWVIKSSRFTPADSEQVGSDEKQGVLAIDGDKGDHERVQED